MKKFNTIMLGLSLSGTAISLAACGDSAPSASDWAAKVVTVCQRLETDRLAAAAALPADQPPSVEQLMAFYAGFAPKFDAYVKEIKAVKQPKGLDTEIKELEAALDGAAAAFHRSATDSASAQAELTSDSQPPEFTRVEAASTAAGLSQCNG